MPNADPNNPAATTPADQAQQWSEQGYGQRTWQQQFFYTLLRTLGVRPAYHMMYVVTFWYVLFYPAVRRRTRHYLSRRFPDRRGFIRRFLTAHRLVRNFGRTLVDLAAFGVMDNPGITASCPDEAKLFELCDRKGGFVLVNAHVGCWQVGMSSLKHLAKPMNVVMIPDPRARKFIDQYGVRIIDPRSGLESVVEMMQALRRGEILGLMGDRAFGDHKNTVKVRFLGGEIAVPVSPYRLASATGVPVVVLLAPRTGPKSYELRVGAIIEVPRGLGQNTESYAAPARQFADCLEQFVRDYPWQFYNFYDLWNPAGPDGEPAAKSDA